MVRLSADNTLDGEGSKQVIIITYLHDLVELTDT